MTHLSHRDKRPTYTHLVLEALVHWPSDFATLRQLVQATGATVNQVPAALHHLRKRRAVDVVIESSGDGFWYATPEDDDRTRHLEERTPEERPRKPRKPRKLRRFSPPRPFRTLPPVAEENPGVQD